MPNLSKAYRNIFKKRIIPAKLLIPNLVTILGLCVGMSSIRYALQGNWSFCILMIWIAALLDTIDGAVARALKATSRFGAELDSLSDFGNFGIAPAIIAYLWYNNNGGHFGWIVALLFMVSIVLRLARFNTSENNNRYFTGIPAPFSALLLLLPIHIDYSLQDIILISKIPYIDIIILIYSILISILVISLIPTISLKSLHIKSKFITFIIIIFVILIALIIINPWIGASIILTGYLIIIPIYYINVVKKLEKRNKSILYDRM